MTDEPIETRRMRADAARIETLEAQLFACETLNRILEHDLVCTLDDTERLATLLRERGYTVSEPPTSPLQQTGQP